VLIILAGASLMAQKTGAEKELLQIQAKRYQAMMAQDLKTLEPMIADELTYCHTSAAVNTKPEYLDLVKTGRIKWLTMEGQDMKATIYGDTGVIVGRLHETLGSSSGKSGVQDLTIRSIEVYVKKDGRWQLAHFQATRVPDTAPRSAP
jgi:ketosteroid isomerase-like protein